MSTSTATPKQVRRGRPAKIDRRQVIEAAVDLAESEGLDALSIRAVAAQVGVDPMALYNHIEGIEDLIDFVVAEIVERTDLEIEWPSDWEGVLMVFAHRMRSTLLAHPVMLQAYERPPIVSSRALEATEHVLAALSAAGLDDDTALDVWVAIHAFVLGFVAVEHGRAAKHVTDERIQELRASLTHQLDTSRDRFPTLQRIGGELTWRFSEEQFDRCLQTVIAALGGSLQNTAANDVDSGVDPL